MTQETGGQAFASGSVQKARVRPGDPGSDWLEAVRSEPIYKGMTLRDYFAAKAMQGFASSVELSWKEGITGMAKEAYTWADAMLKARK